MTKGLLEIVDECVLDIDSKKVRVPDRIRLNIVKIDGNYDVSLGNHCIFSSSFENDAQEVYRKLKSLVESGNYRLVIHPDLFPEIKRLV